MIGAAAAAELRERLAGTGSRRQAAGDHRRCDHYQYADFKGVHDARVYGVQSPPPPLPVVEATVLVLVSVLTPPPPLAVVLVVRPLPPLLVVTAPPVLELELFEDELELELFDAELEPVLEPELVLAVDDELLELELVEVVTVVGVAALVVGIVSVGAPAVSFEPLPLPPQAARIKAASTAALPAAMARI